MVQNPPKVKLNNPSTYRGLLGDQAWARLHPAVQQRFSQVQHRQSVVYKGIMHDVYASFAGILLAQICRLIGTPLALYSGKNIPISVLVYPNEKLKGTTWDRFYFFPNKRVNRVKSTKCIKADSGLIEVVGFGLGMYLRIYEHNSALCFESTRFFWQLGRFKISIPHLLSPGKTIVKQKAINNLEFQFSLEVKHKLLGYLFRQVGTFKQV